MKWKWKTEKYLGLMVMKWKTLELGVYPSKLTRRMTIDGHHFNGLNVHRLMTDTKHIYDNFGNIYKLNID